jgi:hypothetical protein
VYQVAKRIKHGQRDLVGWRFPVVGYAVGYDRDVIAISCESQFCDRNAREPYRLF